MSQRSEEPDVTRARLLQAAGDVFASVGFQAATVREICARAGANVAAVNYHFGDKMGLYVAAFRQSLTVTRAAEIPEERLQSEPPEDLLRAMISHMLHQMCRGDERAVWHLGIMAHEMANPTEALPRVVEEVIGPRYLVLRRILSRIVGLPPDHDTTRLCAHSVIGQVIHYAQGRQVIACLWPALDMKARLDWIANHIARFSICSLQEIATQNARTQ